MEVLDFDGCPSHELLMPHAEQLARTLLKTQTYATPLTRRRQKTSAATGRLAARSYAVALRLIGRP